MQLIGPLPYYFETYCQQPKISRIIIQGNHYTIGEIPRLLREPLI